MAVRIRLKRMGARKQPFYRVVVADTRAARDGAYVEELGYYNPLRDPAEIRLDTDRAFYWLQHGALPSDSARRVLQQAGVWEQWLARKRGETPAPAPAPDASAEAS